jgi:hypothetical protein
MIFRLQPDPDEPDRDEQDEQLDLWDGLDDRLDLGAWMETLPQDEQLRRENR